MEIKNLQQTSSEDLPLNSGRLPIGKNTEAFKVLSQHPVNPKLFGNEGAILEDLEKNHVKVEEVELFGRVCYIVHIDLPPVGNFQGYKADVLMVKSGIDSLIQNGGLDKSNLSDKFSNFLEGLSAYLKSYGIDLGENIGINSAVDSDNMQHNDIFQYIARFVPWDMYTFLLDGGKVLQISGGKGNYHIKNLDSIEINGDCPLSLLSPDSQISENIIYPIPGAHYERIYMYETNYSNWEKESQADKIMGKMDELKNADLVLVFRDNDKYRAMARKVEQLLKYKYGGKVYSIVIPQGTEEKQLTEQDKKVLTEVLTTCNCKTDNTVSEWIGVETEKIDDTLSDKELSDRQNEFLDTARNIESYYMDKGIDTVYILSSYKRDEQGDFKLLLEHGGFCKNINGTIYYIEKDHDQDEEHYNDAKRFWKDLFSSMKVEFIEGEQLLDTGEMCLLKNGDRIPKFIFNYVNPERALAIVDWHFLGGCIDFQGDNGKVITFGGDCFGKGMTIKNNVGEFLAEKICERMKNLD